MSGIVKRTVFYGNTGDVVRFSDWASVVTGIGQMAEPFLPGNRHTVGQVAVQFEPEDQIARIDEMVRVSEDRFSHILSGNTDSDAGNSTKGPVHGGVMIPRTGR